MKTLLNIYFEKLHRYVFHYYAQSQNPHWGRPTPYERANRHNKYERYNEKIYEIYHWLCPYFKGWREDLTTMFPEHKPYFRYK